MGWRGAIGAMVVGASMPACGVGEFACESDEQCAGASPGVCQPDGYCSFPAADCPTGQRYGEHSGPHSGQCVGEGGTQGEGTATGPTGGTAGSGGPTTGDTTSEPPTTGPVVTTADDATSSEPTTGNPIDPDLVLWLALDEPPRGDVLDSSSYMNSGACMLSGCPAAGRGALGAGASFDGIDDVIAVPHAPWLETKDELTIAVFVRVGQAPFEFRSVLTKPVGDITQDSWELYFSAQTLHFTMSDGLVGGTVPLPWEYPPDQWVHLAGTWDGSMITLWADGEAVGSAPLSGVDFDQQPVLVGADDDHDPTGLVGHFLGSIDDVRVYRRALTPEEIAALAAG